MNRIRGVLFLGIGVVLLVGDGVFAVGTVDFQRHAVRVDAVVVDETFGPFHPTVRYTRADGSTVEGPLRVAFDAVELGATVPILYDPDGANDGTTLDKASALWAWQGMGLVLAGLFVVVGAGLMGSGARPD